MWSRKRVLKKERKQYAKKRILFVSFICAGIALFLGIIGFFVLSREPAFISPLPFLRSIGITSDDEIKSAIEKFLKTNNITYSEINKAGGTTYEIVDAPAKAIYISSEKDLSKQLSSLQRIVSRLTMEGKKYTKLDLRYDKPVIVLQ